MMERPVFPFKSWPVESLIIYAFAFDLPDFDRTDRIDRTDMTDRTDRTDKTDIETGLSR